MTFGSWSEESQKRLLALVEEMNGESDRAVAIVGAAWVEDALTEAIVAFLEEHRESSKRLFHGSGPLATFSAKIDLARLLGMTSDAIRSDLHSIRGVRNEFAHHVAHKTEHTRLTFSSAHILDKCLALHCVALERHTDPRAAFTRACAVLNSDLELIRYFGIRVTNSARVVAKGTDGA
jgi:DNA-binding MltR family transcriptional regulator